MSDRPVIHVIPSHRSTVGTRCKHFDGINVTQPEKVCKAGVRMLDVQGDGHRYRYDDSATVYTHQFSLPCIKRWDPEGVCNCAHLEFPSPEQVQAEKAEIVSLLEHTLRVRVKILTHAGGKPRAGAIPCPVCTDGTVDYSVAQNGHVHARCSTQDCVRFME